VYKIPHWSPTRNPLIPINPQEIKDKYYFVVKQNEATQAENDIDGLD
jgi:hypothetical protein